MRSILLILIVLTTHEASAQDPSAYLRTHNYTFSPKEGFNGPLADTLATKLAPYRLILQAEGGSHSLKLYGPLELAWLKFLNQRLNVNYFFGEYGTSIEILFNNYLQTGDSTIRHWRTYPFLQAIRSYNETRPEGQKLSYAGVDFERPQTYFRALKILLRGSDSAGQPPPALESIRNAPDTAANCDELIRFNKTVRKDVDANETAYKEYFGAKNYALFERIVRNNGTCNDVRANRNYHMADNILAFDQIINATHYYGEFGEAHTILKNAVLAGILNRHGAFQNQVAVIDLYCEDCHASEPVSNWPLKDIDADIRRYFLPLCVGDYTFFDLSGDDPSIARYKAYGQFLIIARGQN